ncbi:hypothetical protein F5Y06DRAFT_305654 [Hypoxylon sp. FL0890]|nr:hypothetical protein F5Y06DRAFT_305654 [Hypoxylon sp. FL0890]
MRAKAYLMSSLSPRLRHQNAAGRNYRTERNGVYHPRQWDLDGSHILTGLEPFRVRKLLAQGFEISHSAIQDPRASIIATAFRENRGKSAAGDPFKLDHIAMSPWMRGIPADVVQVLATEADAQSLPDAVLRLTRKQFSNLMLVPKDQIENDKTMLSLGIDSMIASEFRTWFWSAFKVDVPFLDILSPHNSLITLSKLVLRKLEEGLALSQVS